MDCWLFFALDEALGCLDWRSNLPTAFLTTSPLPFIRSLAIFVLLDGLVPSSCRSLSSYRSSVPHCLGYSVDPTVSADPQSPSRPPFDHPLDTKRSLLLPVIPPCLGLAPDCLSQISFFVACALILRPRHSLDCNYSSFRSRPQSLFPVLSQPSYTTTNVPSPISNRAEPS